MLPPLLAHHARHHGRFYASLALGAASFAAARAAGLPVPEVAAADTFFAAFLIASWWLVVTLTDADLERKADIEDEGALVVTLITLTANLYASFAIFTTLNHKSAHSPLSVWLTLAGAPLGWLTLHTVTAFHYANLYYRRNDRPDYVAPLKFPDCAQPGPWDFVYFAFVIGMTAQVSDTLVQTSAMRRAVTAHAIVSFFFNTVLIAMAVNAAVTLAV